MGKGATEAENVTAVEPVEEEMEGTVTELVAAELEAVLETSHTDLSSSEILREVPPSSSNVQLPFETTEEHPPHLTSEITEEHSPCLINPRGRRAGQEEYDRGERGEGVRPQRQGQQRELVGKSSRLSCVYRLGRLSRYRCGRERERRVRVLAATGAEPCPESCTPHPETPDLVTTPSSPTHSPVILTSLPLDMPPEGRPLHPGDESGCSS